MSYCTGDYGLSDCLFVTEEVWDFAESFGTIPSLPKNEEVVTSDTEEDSDLPF
jgi:hypothetical protein